MSVCLLGWTSEERSPVFQQFIECVYNCLKQMPSAFEFNEEFLIFVLRGLQSGLFGNVYANCEKSRLELRHSTLSLWSAVAANRDAFLNPTYQMTTKLCVPVASAKNITVWHRWFLQWNDVISKLLWSARMEDLFAPDENFVDSIMVPARWVEDYAVKLCSEPSCGREFTMYRRRHHCRACGLIYCERCTGYRRIVRSVSSTVLSRCCRSCAAQIDMERRFQAKTHRPLLTDIAPATLQDLSSLLRRSSREVDNVDDDGGSPSEDETKEQEEEEELLTGKRNLTVDTSAHVSSERQHPLSPTTAAINLMANRFEKSNRASAMRRRSNSC